MTAQIHDIVVWRNHDHMLVGVEGTGLFDPFDHGLYTQATTTANWRGWVARYAISEDRLILVDLHDVGLSAEHLDTPPSLQGVSPQLSDRGSYTYAGLNWPIAFSGRLLLARGFIRSLYRHMGFHPAWKFEESWEVDLDRGRVMNARELTEEMRKLRHQIQAGEAADPDSDARPGWIERTFKLDFRRSKGG